ELRPHAVALDGGHHALLDIDSPGHGELRETVEAALEPLPLLPALAVDGDADRVLLTDPTTARLATPFLTGDAMLMLFATHAAADTRQVVFTVESDLTLEKLLEARGVPFDVVTVGDRAVAEWVLARARTSGAEGAHLLCGEPSGH